jgi:hypothetical protein
MARVSELKQVRRIPIVVEGCANLTSAQWVPLQTLTLSNGLVYFGDAQWTN